MERYGIDELAFYALPRDVRARMIAKGRIDGFISIVQQYDSRPKGK